MISGIQSAKLPTSQSACSFGLPASSRSASLRLAPSQPCLVSCKKLRRYAASLCLYLHCTVSALIPQTSMLDCPACLQRCLRAVVRRPNAPLAFRRNVSLPTQLRNNHPRVRPYSTAIEVSRDQGFITARQKVRGASNERWYPGQTENARILAHKHRTHGPRDAVSDHNSDFVGRQLRSELSYLQDPLKLSDRVWQLLHQNDSEKATALVRLACAKIPCVVSWNHIIDWNMSRGKANTALKIYNEVG